jgi:hypothetical protein
MVGLLASLGVLLPSPSLAREIGPETDLCSEINSLSVGEELALRPGDYQGPCAIRRGGDTSIPIVIRAADLQRRPRIVYNGNRTNVFEVRANHVTIRGLEFGPTLEGVDAVRLFTANGVTVEDCYFSHLGGIAVVANYASVRGLTVRRNVIRNSQATAMYFGCHNGIGCVVSGLVVEGNFIEGVNAPDPEIGYGIEVKLNSAAIIRDNVIVNTKGPGIMVYGAQDLVTRSLVERNVTVGSRTSSGIVIGGGPATVRNNISLRNEEAGVGLEDYKARGLLRGVTVVNNTLYVNAGGGVSAPAAGARDVVIVNNAVGVRGGGKPFPAPQPGIHVAGNVDCTWVPCFANAEGMDFSPLPGSMLIGPGLRAGPWLPREDYFGVRRGIQPTVGAIERPSGPISLRPQP